MNRNVALLVGGTVGGSIGYFAAAVIADYLEEKEIRDGAPVSSTETEESESDDEEDHSNKKIMSKKTQKTRREPRNYTEYFNSVNRPDLAALARKYNEGIVDDQSKIDPVLVPVDTDEMVAVSKKEDKTITIISQSDFNNNVDDFEIVCLTYYADKIVVGEDDNIIPGAEDILGNDALVSFGMLSDDPDIVYVRNPKTRALYEVVRVSIKYAIDASADEIIPRRGLKPGIDYDEVNDEHDDKEADS